MSRKSLRENVIKTLEDEGDWLSIAEISRRINVNPTAVRSACLDLTIRGVLEEKHLGVVRLFRIKRETK